MAAPAETSAVGLKKPLNPETGSTQTILEVGLTFTSFQASLKINSWELCVSLRAGIEIQGNSH